MLRPLVFIATLAVALGPIAASATFEPTVPSGFAVERIGTIKMARELAVAPNGDLFVGTSGDTVYLIAEAQTTPQAPKPFVTLPDRPVAGVAIAGKRMLLGAQFGVYSLPYDGARTASEQPKKIAAVRTSGVSSDHITTSVAVTKDRLYASVGSSCNVCDPELDPTRATIQTAELNGEHFEPKARHIRNAIGLAVNPATDTLWAAVAGQDELAHGHPYEIFDAVSAHDGVVDYGWPYCYEDHKAVGNHDCSKTPVPRVVFPAYSTPIGVTFYAPPTGAKYAFPAEYRGGAFVALHGSWHQPVVAPHVVFVPMNGDTPKIPVNWNDPSAQWHEFLTGFQNADGSRNARPTGVAVGSDGSLFVSDDFTGAIYRIRPQR